MLLMPFHTYPSKYGSNSGTKISVSVGAWGGGLEQAPFICLCKPCYYVLYTISIHYQAQFTTNNNSNSIAQWEVQGSEVMHRAQLDWVPIRLRPY